MIVFVESDTNDFVIYLNPSLHAQKVRLVSCSLYNSWYNLRGGVITTPQGIPLTIPDSHYTPQTLAKELSIHKVALITGLPHEWRLIRGAGRTINQPIKDLIGYKMVSIPGAKSSIETFHWKMPYSYEIHCDLVRSYGNGAPSHLMARFSPKGDPFNLVEYRPISLEYLLSNSLVSTFHIAVKVDGEVVNFNGRKISLVLELI